MKNVLRSALAASALLLASVSVRAATPGYVDLGQFKPADGCEFVEINLHHSLLKFAAMFVDKDDPKAADLIRSLQHVRVNVVGYDDSTRTDTTTHVQRIRHELEAQGWEQMVTVQQGGKQQDVVIYVKTSGDDAIEGLVVTVLDAGEKQAVLVNVVGNIKPEQLAAVGKGLHIDSLDHLKVTPKA